MQMTLKKVLSYSKINVGVAESGGVVSDGTGVKITMQMTLKRKCFPIRNWMLA